MVMSVVTLKWEETIVVFMVLALIFSFVSFYEAWWFEKSEKEKHRSLYVLIALVVISANILIWVF